MVAASFSPLRAAMLDVGKPWIEEDGGGIARFAADNGDTGFAGICPRTGPRRHENGVSRYDDDECSRRDA
jgi:hypothetical protein